jgi:hypothetical protein
VGVTFFLLRPGARAKKSGLVRNPPGNPAEPERIGLAFQPNFYLLFYVVFLFIIMKLRAYRNAEV